MGQITSTRVHQVGVELRWCPECAQESWFEVPPCEDGHGFDCLDLACVECGFGLVLGPAADHHLPDVQPAAPVAA